MFWDFVRQNNIEELQIILNANPIEKSVLDSYGYSPLHIAISKGYTDIAKALIDCDFNCNMQDPKGQTPLHYCAFYNNVDIAELLLQSNASLNISDNYGNQPLWTAVFNDKGFGRRIEIVKLFLGYDADKYHKNAVHISPLEMAIDNNYTELISILND